MESEPAEPLPESWATFRKAVHHADPVQRLRVTPSRRLLRFAAPALPQHGPALNFHSQANLTYGLGCSVFQLYKDSELTDVAVLKGARPTHSLLL